MIGETSTTTVFNRRNNKKYFIEDRYDEAAMEFEIEMAVMWPEGMTLHERRDFENQMFYNMSYDKFYIDYADDYYGETYEVVEGHPVMSYFMARFVNPSRIIDGAGRTVGYNCTLQCDGAILHQDSIPYELNMSLPFATLDVDSDTHEYVYPIVTIVVGDSGGTIEIYNESDDEDRKTTFDNLSAGETLVINSETNQITSDMSDNRYTDFVNANFPRLISGENYIRHSGDIASITYEYSNRRYL